MSESEMKQRILERINSPVEWPDNGEARMGLLQVAYDRGWYMKELQ